jgi:hypothetical protein
MIVFTGKTIAFMLPILERLLYKPKQSSVTRVLILVPTRELAVQVHTVGKQLANYTNIELILAAGMLNIKLKKISSNIVKHEKLPLFPLLPLSISKAVLSQLIFTNWYVSNLLVKSYNLCNIFKILKKSILFICEIYTCPSTVKSFHYATI